MRDLLELTKNVKKGPKSSIIGFVLFIAGGYMIYSDWKSPDPENALTYTSIEVGIFALGLYLFLSSDSPFGKKSDIKEVKDEEE